MMNVARELALAWWVSDHWGDPACTDAYQSFLQDYDACPTKLAESLLYEHRSDIQVIRAYASRLLGQMRRAYNFDIMPAKQTWGCNKKLLDALNEYKYKPEEDGS